MSKNVLGKGESILLPYMSEMSEIFDQALPDKGEALQFVDKLDHKIENSQIVPKSKTKMRGFLQDFRNVVEQSASKKWAFRFMKWFTDAILRKSDLGVISSLKDENMILTKEGRQKVTQELLFVANFLQEVRDGITKRNQAIVAKELDSISSMLIEANPEKAKTDS